jgi:hypothetical protein
MKTPVRCVVIATLCPALAVLALPGLRVAHGLNEAAKQPVLTERAFLAIVKESNKFIQEPLAKARPSFFFPTRVNPVPIRSNALLIALSAQNRMGSAGADASRLATLRDAALKLGITVQKQPQDLPELVKLANILDQYPNLDADPNASLAPVRLKDRFNHDDVVGLFGGCSANRTQRIEFHLFKLLRQKTPYTQAQTEQLELLAYKVALIGELLPEFDTDFVPAQKQEQRPEWVRFANEVQQTGWQLAETTQSGNYAHMQRSLTKLTNGCAACHEKFRDCQ